MKRRAFLGNSVIAVVGAGALGGESLGAAGEPGKDEAPKIKEFRSLGKTGFKVSDLSVGFTADEGVLNAALDSGINYLDTAPLYLNGQCERAIGNVLKKRDRKKYFITTRVIATPLAAQMSKVKDFGKTGIIQSINESLKRLQTNYVDCMMMAPLHQLSDVKEKGFHEAFKQLKAEGKVKFAGIASHGGYSPYIDSQASLRDGLLAAVEDGRFDIIMPVYNFLTREQCDDVLEKCKKKEIAVVLMKTNPVGTYFGVKAGMDRFEKEGKEVPAYMKMSFDRLKKQYQQAEGFLKKHKLEDPGEIGDAAIKFCLNNANASSVVLTIRNFDEVTRYIGLSGKRLTAANGKVMNVFRESMGKLYCRHGCGDCEAKCPRGVPVNTVMRYNHYFTAQGREKYAMEQYAGLPSPVAAQCQECAGACESACPHGVPIQTLLQLAHRNLTLA